MSFTGDQLTVPASWSAEIQLNTDGTTTDQWYPAIAVNENGVVVASWYDRRLDTANNMRFDRYARVSADGGLSWGPNKRISDVSSPVASVNPNFDTIIAIAIMEITTRWPSVPPRPTSYGLMTGVTPP